MKMISAGTPVLVNAIADFGVPDISAIVDDHPAQGHTTDGRDAKSTTKATWLRIFYVT